MLSQGKHRRRWFQFRLRTLLAVGLAGGLCGYVGWQARFVALRNRIEAQAVATVPGRLLDDDPPVEASDL